MMAPLRVLLVVVLIGIAPALAQEIQQQFGPVPDTDTRDPTPPGTLNPEPLPPLANPNSPPTPAKELFARKTEPLAGPARSIGSYADGCLAGAVPLPITGPSWQVMRLSRNRNWGNPKLVAFIERVANKAKKVGWNGLLIGDMAQPRGGPMINCHSSHQIGLDVDIWFMAMPNRVMSRAEREFDNAVDMVSEDGLGVNPKVWTPTRTALVRTVAQDPDTTRIFVNAAIKKEMCEETAGSDRKWLAKVRPWWGHAEHFHVRISCPPDSKQCKAQPPVPPGDGCGHALDYWFKKSVLHPPPPKVPSKPAHAMTLAALPAACRAVVKAP